MAAGRVEFFRYQVERHIPGAFSQFTVFSHQRRGKSIRMIDKAVTITPLDAKTALIGDAFTVPPDTDHGVPAYPDVNTAANTAINPGAFHLPGRDLRILR